MCWMKASAKADDWLFALAEKAGHFTPLWVFR
jgi:hypothetical protein